MAEGGNIDEKTEKSKQEFAAKVDHRISLNEIKEKY